MKKSTFIRKTESAIFRANTTNAMRYINALVRKFNETQDKYSANFVCSVNGQGYCQTIIKDKQTGQIQHLKIKVPLV